MWYYHVSFIWQLILGGALRKLGPIGIVEHFVWNDYSWSRQCDIRTRRDSYILHHFLDLFSQLQRCWNCSNIDWSYNHCQYCLWLLLSYMVWHNKHTNRHGSGGVSDSDSSLTNWRLHSKRLILRMCWLLLECWAGLYSSWHLLGQWTGTSKLDESGWRLSGIDADWSLSACWIIHYQSHLVIFRCKLKIKQRLQLHRDNSLRINNMWRHYINDSSHNWLVSLRKLWSCNWFSRICDNRPIHTSWRSKRCLPRNPHFQSWHRRIPMDQHQ